MIESFGVAMCSASMTGMRAVCVLRRPWTRTPACPTPLTWGWERPAVKHPVPEMSLYFVLFIGQTKLAREMLLSLANCFHPHLCSSLLTHHHLYFHFLTFSIWLFFCKHYVISVFRKTKKVEAYNSQTLPLFRFPFFLCGYIFVLSHKMI